MTPGLALFSPYFSGMLIIVLGVGCVVFGVLLVNANDELGVLRLKLSKAEDDYKLLMADCADDTDKMLKEVETGLEALQTLKSMLTEEDCRIHGTEY